jgi:hypothetical protein
MSTAQMSSNSYSYLSLRVVTLTLQWRCTDFFKKGHLLIKPPTEASSIQTWMMSQVLCFSFHGKLVIAKPLKKVLLYKHHKVNMKSATPVPTHLHDNHPNKKHR